MEPVPTTHSGVFYGSAALLGVIFGVAAIAFAVAGKWSEVAVAVLTLVGIGAAIGWMRRSAVLAR